MTAKIKLGWGSAYLGQRVILETATHKITIKVVGIEEREKRVEVKSSAEKYESSKKYFCCRVCGGDQLFVAHGPYIIKRHLDRHKIEDDHILYEKNNSLISSDIKFENHTVGGDNDLIVVFKSSEEHDKWLAG